MDIDISCDVGQAAPRHLVRETDAAFIVEVELPGVERSRADVGVRGRVVTITGSRSADVDTEPRGDSSAGGTFHVELHLPAMVAQDQCHARLVDGVMTLRLPKWQPQSTPVRID